MGLDSSNLIKTLETELQQRLEKLWRVFSWCSSILITITGGLIFATRSENKFDLFILDRIIISAIIAVITTYGWLWINENLSIETKIRNRINELYETELAETFFRTHRPDLSRFGYLFVIISLGVASLFTTWLSCITN